MLIFFKSVVKHNLYKDLTKTVALTKIPQTYYLLRFKDQHKIIIIQNPHKNVKRFSTFEPNPTHRIIIINRPDKKVTHTRTKSNSSTRIAR